MKFTLLTLLFALITLIKSGQCALGLFTPEWIDEIASRDPEKDTGGGIDCIACTLVLTVVENYAVVHEESIQDTLFQLCKSLPKKVEYACDALVLLFASQIEQDFKKGEGPDTICHKLKVCTDSTCRLHPHRTSVAELREVSNRPYKGVEEAGLKFGGEKRKVGDWPWWLLWLKDIIMRVADHKPELDLDGDLFSTIGDLRGSRWRGKDCNDTDASIYAGRASDGDPALDGNCNGIYGVDENYVSYEQKWCGETPGQGLIVLGDSAGAHFSIPPSFFNASEINKHTYSDILDIAAMEFDWPSYGGYTGFMGKEQPTVRSVTGVPNLKFDSMYMNLLERNRCNHRDFQNVAVNGARSTSIGKIITTMARHTAVDKPALVFMELIGNDVCNSHTAVSHMTPKKEFKEKITEALRLLDTMLPKGSHVVSIGLARGLTLFEAMHARLHPIGVTYADVYDFLNCHEASPCAGWMNTNATVRNATQAHADLLNTVYPELVKELKFDNFEYAYYKFPFEQIKDMWLSKGGQIWELIEPSDGFHPSYLANVLMADVYEKALQRDHPDWLGAINPNNDAIKKKFGDQGGY